MDTPVDLHAYDRYVICVSGGKDSIASKIALLDEGVDPERIEIWHQSVDGMENTLDRYFDWPCTEGYVREIAAMFNLRLQWSWRAFGMSGEMHRQHERTKDVFYRYEGSDERHHLPTTGGQESTRRKFPAKTIGTARWCSGYLKIQVAGRVLSDLSAFKGTKEEPFRILYVTGERAEESKNRSRYPRFAEHPSTSSVRTVHHYRPVLHWSERRVWDVMQSWGILPHPAYYLGFPRVSCRSCIFLSPNQWATLAEIHPDVIDRIERDETDFQFTLDNNVSIRQLVGAGTSMIDESNRHWIPLVQQDWRRPVLVAPDEWQMPKGAYGAEGGAI
ncbi:3'-phosphoadenosine 5'-phosphosulfate sulfotransferase (PAPS reductase)/FAD synthetase [Catalinimonas alkaloidigena]|uniref:3'-phosphoadenosine 5'-phosphosulfate sulfotransferase (PAPS reductase)/FAD synthetase n=1 Tax=Catalinimonas alkaloidigena TaxID=1075417 RepID=A0A1G9V6F8_9BACT|nr:phosphoadenosine phosphosulfate reductase family protein [Catalinimonas alkaloidigena]SDM67495.1 3'-phosphoadenosine 5'-phosphosulfate sulfotransferase (PAPS reductase)/FAD synthetase [Catalinimonas alkaloidigena]